MIMYKILKNQDNDLLLVIEPQDCEPDGPMFIYDGGDTALLFRDWDSNIRLNAISPETTPELMNVKTIYVVEMSGDAIAREYAAPVRIVRDVKSMMM